MKLASIGKDQAGQKKSSLSPRVNIALYKFSLPEYSIATLHPV